MGQAELIQDRDALYYPFIHVRDEKWLRSALLFFPHVIRMTPPRYKLHDTPFVQELATTLGRRDEPLVGTYELDSPAVTAARNRLAERFEVDICDSAFRARYGRTATVTRYRSDSVFQMHPNKYSPRLEQCLRQGELIWEPLTPDPEPEDWLAVHPVIGEIIMSTVAAAAARNTGCDILTDTPQDHQVTATRDETVIYDTLLGRIDDDGERRTDVRELGDLVIATTFDLSSLTPADFAAISREHEVLADFRQLLADRAAEIPVMSDHERRHRYVQEAAEEIVADWEAKRWTWGNFLKRTFRLEAADEAKGAATNILEASMPFVLGGAATTAAVAGGAALLAAVPGLAVGYVTYGAKVWRDLGVEEKTTATRFLSHVAANGGILAAAGG